MNHQEDYLTVGELSERIKFSRQTLYNMIFAKKFVKGQHYIKPSRKKVLFKWSVIQAWLEDRDPAGDDTIGKPCAPSNAGPENRIHI
jgi:predicted DNA-binding transcriptional regulator AlpA